MTPQDYKFEFIMKLNNEGIRYTNLDDNALKLSYAGDNTSHIEVIAFFDVSDYSWGYVTFTCYSFGRVVAKNRVSVLAACSRLSYQHVGVQYYIDKDDDVVVRVDSPIDINNAGEICYFLLHRLVSAYDDSIPMLSQANYA